MDKARLKLGAVPVRVAAKVYGRDPAWVRAGIIAGWLPIGEATRNGRRKGVPAAGKCTTNITDISSGS